MDNSGGIDCGDDDYVWKDVKSGKYYENDVTLAEHLACLVDDKVQDVVDFFAHCNSWDEVKKDALGEINYCDDLDIGVLEFRKVYYVPHWETVSVHLTRTAAERYSNDNEHYLWESRILVLEVGACP